MPKKIIGITLIAVLFIVTGTISYAAASHKYNVTQHKASVKDEASVPADSQIKAVSEVKTLPNDEDTKASNKKKVASDYKKIEGNKEGTVTVKTEKKVSDSKKISTNIQYPVIKGLKNKDIENKINAALQKPALDMEKSAKQSAKDISDGIKGEAELKCKITYNRQDVLSVYFIGYLYTGGAHGEYLQDSYTFNLKTGHEYSLKDFFKENTNYIPIINSQIKKQAKAKGILPESLPKSIDSDQKFYLKKDSLVIYYKDLPYVLGTPEFEIPFSIFGSSINKLHNN